MIVGCEGDTCYDDYCYDDYYYDDYDDHYYDDDDYEDGSTEKTLFVYLNVGDQDGNPLEGATVWVDSRQQENRTEDQYDELGDQFPEGWRGWRYNWSGGPFWIDLRDCSNRECMIEILVSKTGYDTQRTTITLEQQDPDEVYMRQTLVMERQVGVGSARVVDAPQEPELISLDDPDWRG